MTTVKQTAPDWCFYNDSLNPEEYYQKIKELGFYGVEMVDPARREAAIQAGLKLYNYGAPGMMEGLNNPDNHLELISGISETIEEANRFEIPQVIIFSGNSIGISQEEGIKNCLDALEYVVPVAEKNGVVLTFEMLNSFDHEGYQADNSDYGFEIVKHFNSDNVKVLYDIYHMFRMKEDVVADIKNNLSAIAHIHIAGNPGRNNPAVANEIDYPAIIKEVLAAGYTGCWGQEFVLKNNFVEELKTASKLFSQ